MGIVNLLISPFKLGCSPLYDEETNRRIVVINLLTFIGMILTLCFGLNSLMTADLWMGGFLLAISAALLLARSIIDLRRPPSEQRLPATLLICLLFALMILLIVTGGKQNTGTMWIYILPPVALFFAGLRVGLLIISLFIASMSLLLFYPGDKLLLTTYTLGYKIRFLLSLLTTIIFSTVYEYSRLKSIERIQRLNQKFEHLAMHDSLTRLPNRRYAQDQLVQEQARAKRKGSVTGVILCDIDKFKQINDKYGHDCGDQVLIFLADIMKNNIRKQDVVARWGGEEFLFILPDTHSREAAVLAKAILKKIAQTPYRFRNVELCITASFGVSMLSCDTKVNEVLTQTDDALYTAKGGGRNQVVEFEADSLE